MAIVALGKQQTSTPHFTNFAIIFILQAPKCWAPARDLSCVVVGIKQDNTSKAEFHASGTDQTPKEFIIIPREEDTATSRSPRRTLQKIPVSLTEPHLFPQGKQWQEESVALMPSP